MPTWRKIGDSTDTDTHIGNSDLTVSGATNRLLHLDSVSGTFEITNYQDKTLVKYNPNFITYGNDESNILHQFKTFNNSAEGGSGPGMSVTFGPDIAQFLNCDSFVIQSDENDSSAEPSFILRRSNQDASVVDNDFLGEIDFQGRRIGGANESYASIQVIARDVSAGIEDGEIALLVKTNGSSQAAVQVKSLNQANDVVSDSLLIYGRTLSSLIQGEFQEFSVSGQLLNQSGGEIFVNGDNWYDNPIVIYDAQKTGELTSVSISYSQYAQWPSDKIRIRIYKNGSLQGEEITFTPPNFDNTGYKSNSNVAHLDAPIDLVNGDEIKVTWMDAGSINNLTKLGLVSATLNMRRFD